MARRDSYKSPNKEIFQFLCYGLGVYLLLNYLYFFDDIQLVLMEQVEEGPLKNMLDNLFFASDQSRLLLKIGLVVCIILFAGIDEFEVKKAILDRTEKRPLSSNRRHLILVLVGFIVLFALHPATKVEMMVLGVVVFGLIVNRDFPLTLAVLFPGQRSFWLQLVNAANKRTTEKSYGYDTLQSREKMLNARIIGHNEDPLFFYHKFHSKHGVDMLYNGNPRRGNAVIGTAGSGKTASILDPMAIQTIRDLQIPMAEYDFKFPNQTKVALYQYANSKMQAQKEGKPFRLKFACSSLEAAFIHNTFRTNPISERTIRNDFDNDSYIQTFLSSFNPRWIENPDFWANSAYAIGAAVVLMHRKYMPGFTLAHILHFMSQDYVKQAACMMSFNDDQLNAKIEQIRKPIVEGTGKDQLAGVYGTLQNVISKMHNKYIFYNISGDDVPFKINAKEDPYLFCIGNSNEYKGIFAPFISLYYSLIFQLCNVPDGSIMPMHVLIDEAATLNLNGIQDLINTGRSNGIITTLGFQGMKQSNLIYGDKLAAVIMTSMANWYYGQIEDRTFVNEVVQKMGKYRHEIENVSRSKKNTTYTSSVQTDDFVRFEEVGEFDKGYFVGKMAEGDHNRFMGKIDISEYLPIYEESKGQVLPLSPSVMKLAREGDMTKDDMSRYYNGDEKATNKIREAADQLAEREYKRIIQESNEFMNERIY